jgi:putative endonuclease
MKHQKIFYTYILECADKTFYTGFSNNLEGRLQTHIDGIHIESYTYSRRPVKLVYYEEYESVINALEREKQIKGWSRKKKLALIEGRLDDLPKLAKKVWRNREK